MREEKTFFKGFFSFIRIFANYKNDLKSTHPQIAKEWSEKNYPLQPDEVNAKSRKNVWWHCKRCGNEWKSVINARVKGTVCPVCAEREVLAGYNDLATMDKDIPLEQVAIQVKAAIVTESQKAVEKREAVEKDKPTKSKNEIITEEAVRKPLQKGYDRSNRTDLE